MSEVPVVILGCGYTGQRVARLFLASGRTVIATARRPEDLDLPGAEIRALGADGAEPIDIPEGALVLHSIPTVETPEGPREFTPEILARLTRQPSRIVYLSTTGVYGLTRDVDENTPPAPVTQRERMRVEAEEAVRGGPWESLVLRPAAIYGPDRGIHVSMRQGRFQLAGAGDNYVSRIHVDDLAAHAQAALLSHVTGAYPVGDDHPCTSREIAEYCARVLNLPMPQSAPRDSLHETRRADRRVDGRAIRELLHLTLRYPSYRDAIRPAS